MISYSKQTWPPSDHVYREPDVLHTADLIKIKLLDLPKKSKREATISSWGWFPYRQGTDPGGPRHGFSCGHRYLKAPIGLGTLNYWNWNGWNRVARKKGCISQKALARPTWEKGVCCQCVEEIREEGGGGGGGILLCRAIVVQVAQIKPGNPHRAPQKVLSRRRSLPALKERDGIWPFEDSDVRLEHILNWGTLRGVNLQVGRQQTGWQIRGRQEILMRLY